MKTIRRYYTRKQVADILGIKRYEVSSKIVTIKCRAKYEIKRLEKQIDKLSSGKGNKLRYTEYHLEQLKQEITK